MRFLAVPAGSPRWQQHALVMASKHGSSALQAIEALLPSATAGHQHGRVPHAAHSPAQHSLNASMTTSIA